MKENSKLSPVSQRLTEWIKSKRMTVAQFEKSLGFCNGYVRNIRKSISFDKIDIIKEKYPDFPYDWVMLGKSEDTPQNGGMNPMSISGILSTGDNASITQNNGSVTHETEEGEIDYKKMYIGSLKTIKALRKILYNMIDNACGENISLKDLDELDAIL